MKIKAKKFFYNLVGITCGSILLAIAWAWFLIPFKIAPGGVGCISQIFYHFWNIPAGMVILAINIPLMILGTIMVGKNFGLGTIAGTVLSAVFTDILSVKNLYDLGFARSIIEEYNRGKPFHEWAMTDNTLLAALAGSLLMGLAIGIIFRFRGSTAGTDIPVAIFKKYFNLPITMGYLLVDTVIIIIVGLVFKSPNLIIWGIFSLFIASKVCDITAEGLPYVKGVMIISDSYEKIKTRIIKELDRGITVLNGEGGFHGEKKKILYCTITRRELFDLNDIVKEEDDSAFLIITDVYDVIGKGFKSRSLGMWD